MDACPEPVVPTLPARAGHGPMRPCTAPLRVPTGNTARARLVALPAGHPWQRPFTDGAPDASHITSPCPFVHLLRRAAPAGRLLPARRHAQFEAAGTERASVRNPVGQRSRPAGHPCERHGARHHGSRCALLHPRCCRRGQGGACGSARLAAARWSAETEGPRTAGCRRCGVRRRRLCTGATSFRTGRRSRPPQGAALHRLDVSERSGRSGQSGQGIQRLSGGRRPWGHHLAVLAGADVRKRHGHVTGHGTGREVVRDIGATRRPDCGTGHGGTGPAVRIRQGCAAQYRHGHRLVSQGRRDG